MSAHSEQIDTLIQNGQYSELAIYLDSNKDGIQNDASISWDRITTFAYESQNTHLLASVSSFEVPWQDVSQSQKAFQKLFNKQMKGYIDKISESEVNLFEDSHFLANHTDKFTPFFEEVNRSRFTRGSTKAKFIETNSKLRALSTKAHSYVDKEEDSYLPILEESIDKMSVVQLRAEIKDALANEDLEKVNALIYVTNQKNQEHETQWGYLKGIVDRNDIVNLNNDLEKLQYSQKELLNDQLQYTCSQNPVDTKEISSFIKQLKKPVYQNTNLNAEQWKMVIDVALETQDTLLINELLFSAKLNEIDNPTLQEKISELDKSPQSFNRFVDVIEAKNLTIEDMELLKDKNFDKLFSKHTASAEFLNSMRDKGLSTATKGGEYRNLCYNIKNYLEYYNNPYAFDEVPKDDLEKIWSYLSDEMKTEIINWVAVEDNRNAGIELQALKELDLEPEFKALLDEAEQKYNDNNVGKDEKEIVNEISFDPEKFREEKIQSVKEIMIENLSEQHQDLIKDENINSVESIKEVLEENGLENAVIVMDRYISDENIAEIAEYNIVLDEAIEREKEFVEVFQDRKEYVKNDENALEAKGAEKNPYEGMTPEDAWAHYEKSMQKYKQDMLQYLNDNIEDSKVRQETLLQLKGDLNACTEKHSFGIISEAINEAVEKQEAFLAEHKQSHVERLAEQGKNQEQQMGRL